MKPSDLLMQFAAGIVAAVTNKQDAATLTLQRTMPRGSVESPNSSNHLSSLGAFFQQALHRIAYRSSESINYLKLKQAIASEVEQPPTKETVPDSITTSLIAHYQPVEPNQNPTATERLALFCVLSAASIGERAEQHWSSFKKSLPVDKPAPLYRNVSNYESSNPSSTPNRSALLNFGLESISTILKKGSNQWYLLKSKISVIKHTNSSTYNLPTLEADQQELEQIIDRYEKPNRSSTKSIKLTENSQELEEPFNLTIKTRNDLTARHSNQLSHLTADSLNYSNTHMTADFTANRMDVTERRAESPEKKQDDGTLEEVIPQELKYSPKELEPDSPGRMPFTEFTPTKLYMVRHEVEELQKRSRFHIENEKESGGEQSDDERYYDSNSCENKHPIQKFQTIEVKSDIANQPQEQVVTEASPAITDRKPTEEDVVVLPTPYSMRSIKKHKVRLQKELVRQSKDSKDSKDYADSRQRVESVESRLNTDQSLSQQVSHKNLSINSRRGDQSVRAPSRSNIFNTEIDNYKERIMLLQEAKSRKRLLEDQLNNLNEQINEMRKIEEPAGGVRKNKIKYFIGISDDHDARVKAVQLVNRMKKYREKKHQSILNNFGRVDNSIIDSMNELARIREERERKTKYQKRLEVLERMREHERKKQENNSLKQASRNFVHAIKQEPHMAGAVVTEVDNEPEPLPEKRYRKQPTEHVTPELKQQPTPELDSKKERLRKLRKFHFNYVSKRSIVYDYNALLFKN